MPSTTVDAEQEYSEEKFTAREVFRSDHSKVVCGYFEPNPFIPVHAPDSDVAVVVQSGRGIILDGEQTHQIVPGSVMTVPAGQDRGVRADDERLGAVLVTAPPPSDADQKFVRQGLKRGEFEPRSSAE